MNTTDRERIDTAVYAAVSAGFKTLTSISIEMQRREHLAVGFAREQHGLSLSRIADRSLQRLRRGGRLRFDKNAREWETL